MDSEVLMMQFMQCKITPIISLPPLGTTSIFVSKFRSKCQNMSFSLVSHIVNRKIVSFKKIHFFQ